MWSYDSDLLAQSILAMGFNLVFMVILLFVIYLTKNGRLKRNQFVGVRYKLAFESEDNWNFIQTYMLKYYYLIIGLGVFSLMLLGVCFNREVIAVVFVAYLLIAAVIITYGAISSKKALLHFKNLYTK